MMHGETCCSPPLLNASLLVKDKPKVSVRTKLLSEMGSSLEGISPVTLKDVRNMQAMEAGGRGLLKARGYTPNNTAAAASPLSARNQPPLIRKRLREEEGKENTSIGASPRLTPKRPKILARRPLREGKMAVITTEQRYVLDMVSRYLPGTCTYRYGTGRRYFFL